MEMPLEFKQINHKLEMKKIYLINQGNSQIILNLKTAIEKRDTLLVG